MEPIRDHQPEATFLEDVREIATTVGATLIFDEVTCGWRLNSGGIHLLYAVAPDIAVFAKAMSNGYPMAAVIGTADVMQAAQDSFISSTSWTERIGPVAALATIKKHRRCEVGKALGEIGRHVQSGWQAAAKRSGLPIAVTGIPPLSHFVFTQAHAPAMKTLFTQLMLERGFLATNAFYASFAHREVHVEGYLKAVQEAFAVIAEAETRERVERLLKGPIAHTGFYRLT
jgi:glutamate-1-semialdehyde aminotransferase